MNILDVVDDSIMVYKAGFTFKFSFTHDGFMVEMYNGAQKLGSFGRTYQGFIDQIEDEEDWHNFVDDDGEMHLCMKCGDGADGFLHFFDPNVTTTPVPAEDDEPQEVELQALTDVDDLDELLASADWVKPTEAEEDLPLAQTDDE